jgi:hypothetical protein
MQWPAADSAVSIAAVDFDSAFVAVGDQNPACLTLREFYENNNPSETETTGSSDYICRAVGIRALE